eukprot:6967539-Alexandrium_andersonii.AAC.1
MTGWSKAETTEDRRNCKTHLLLRRLLPESGLGNIVRVLGKAQRERGSAQMQICKVPNLFVAPGQQVDTFASSP